MARHKSVSVNRKACHSAAALLTFSILTSLPVSALADDPTEFQIQFLQPLDNAQPADAQPTDAQPAVPEPEPDPLAELEQLLRTPVVAPALEQEVTTVSRQVSTVGKSPAAVFVVTQDMIRRSGATSIPEVLRMVPGLQVARIDSNKWSVTSRGFAERFFNRHLLVQIDGRAVYNVITSTVYWDAVDVMLEDVERIEVVRGPGSSVWGANAVNGVINIITKSAKDTRGGLVSAGGGSEERGFGSFRYGGGNGGSQNWRAYGKYFNRDNAFNANGDAQDNWRLGQGGFRMDWQPSCCDSVTLQGDIFEDYAGRRDFNRAMPTPPFSFTNTEDEISSGGNVLYRWTRELDDERSWTLQTYYDRWARRTTNRNFDWSVDTFDADFQHRFGLSYSQVVWGVGYRLNNIHWHGSADGGFMLGPAEDTFNNETVSAFIQDQLTLVSDRLILTTGIKLQQNDFSDFEYQPTARLLWTPSERRSVWAAFSRAVRTPNYSEHFVSFTGAITPGASFFRTVANPGFDSEEMFAYECGYRAQPNDYFSWDLAVFFNKYDELLVRRTDVAAAFAGPGATVIFPVNQFNGMDGETYGLELSGNFQMTECWRLYAQYTFLQIQLHADDPVDSPFEPTLEDLSPHNQVYMMSSWDIGCNVEFDLIGRYTDDLTVFNPDVDGYIAMDMRLAWRPRCNLEFSVVGQNLTDSHHPEYGQGALVTNPTVEIQRGVYGMVRYTW